MKNTTTTPKAEGARAAQANEQMQGRQEAEGRRGNADILKAESRNLDAEDGREHSDILKAENRNLNAAQSREQKVESGNPAVVQFRVPTGEKDFLATLMQFMRSAKRSKDREVANAARRWETAIEFRIRMTMQHRERVANRRVHQGLVRLGK